MPRLSACVITFNEECKIAACLGSLVGVADEIVVVDSESTDDTVAIAAQFTDRIIVQPFLGYVAQKNFTVDCASYDWILSLDADEQLSDELRSEILKEKGVLGAHAGYDMPRRTFYVDKWMDHCWYPDRRIRLFDRRRGRWRGTDPHDSWRVTEGSVNSMRGDILHRSFDSVSDHLQTIDRFSEIAARELFRQGRRASAAAPVVHGAATFVRLYLLKRGFLDGFGGLVVSLLSATASFTRYAKLRYLQRAEGRGSDS
jgi:glycosyltransferase involved in cell wall biosynthesis